MKDRATHGKNHRAKQRPPFDRIALLLQGGGALGAFQSGVYEALAEAHLEPDWVAGISIGAITAAIIAGNRPAERVARLREFWETITRQAWWDGDGHWCRTLLRGDAARGWVNQANAATVATIGADGFFTPRPLSPWLAPAGSLEATSYYDTTPLRSTLERLVDFDRINAGPMRLSVGAVNVATGNFVYFDTETHTIGPEHIMASGALPPGFPAVEIEGEYYWDGGLVSNTPLQWVLESEPQRDTLAFQVDLWSARGLLPRTVAEVATRQKEIQFSSRTRANSDRFRRDQALRCALSRLLDRLPEEYKTGPEMEVLLPAANHRAYSLVQLIYRAKHYEGDSKDYEFSRRSMEEHWRSGYHDTVRTLRHPDALKRPDGIVGIRTFDVAQDGRE